MNFAFQPRTRQRAATLLKAAPLAVLLALGAGMGAEAAKDDTPIGFDQFIVYMGTGVMDFTVDEPRPGHTNCTDGVFCTNLFFQEEIMKRSPAEIAVLEQAAKDFFEARFGIPIDAYAAAGTVVFRPWTLHPDFDYRVYAFEGDFAPRIDVPRQGWEVRDGGWIVSVLDPNGVTLGGEFAGLHVPVGTSMLFGNYNILATDSQGRPIREIIINYRSILPIIFREDGSFLFRCQLDAEDIPGNDFNDGIVMGHADNRTLPDGRVKGNGRNVLTFPPLGRIDNLLDLTNADIREYLREMRQAQN